MSKRLSLVLSSLSLAIAATFATQAAEVELIPREALFGNPDRIAVQLSPDGKSISWVAPVNGVQNVWVAPASDPGKARPITQDTTRGIRNHFWTYRPDTVLYLRDTGGDEDFHLYSVDLATGTTRDLTPFPKTRAEFVGASHLQPDTVLVAMNDRDPKWHDLYRVDLRTGERSLIEHNNDEIASYLADGNLRLRMVTRARADGGNELLRPDGKGGWTLVDTIPFADSLTTSPGGFTTDGKTLYMADSRGRDKAALFGVDVDSGARKLLMDDARVDVGGSLRHPETGKADAVTVEYLRGEWKALDPSMDKAVATLNGIGRGTAWVNSRTLDDNTWLVGYADARTPNTYYRYDRSGNTLTRLFSAFPVLEGKPLVDTWPQEIKSRDGLTLVSYLTLPASADANHDGQADAPTPMVLLVHGGPWGRDGIFFDREVQWLANRGYAVLQVNFRGSTGFGKDFVNKADGEWAGKMHDDLIDAVNWAVDHKVTTKDQVAIMGGSYGGYATLVGLTFTPDTFKCGVDIVGPSNLNTLLSTIPPYWAAFFEQFAKRVGDPRTPEGKQLLAARSPLTRVEAISKPLLIGQGANDPRVKQAESDQIVQAMQARNIPVTYALFPDEGHGFARPENNKAFNAVAEGFLGQCLGGRVEPVGDDLAGSSLTVPHGAGGVPGLDVALKAHTAESKK